MGERDGAGTIQVVVTGLGVVSAVGVGLDENWRRLLAGESGVRASAASTPRRSRARSLAKSPGFDPHTYMERKEARRMDRFAQFAVAAAREALASGRVSPSRRQNAERVGVIVGSAMGGMAALDDAYADAARARPRARQPVLRAHDAGRPGGRAGLHPARRARAKLGARLGLRHRRARYRRGRGDHPARRRRC